LDAITITKRLGLQFLWVDKLCIDQDNPQTKPQQSSRMDEIYYFAENTTTATTERTRRPICQAWEKR
jgi:hypothetical protein